MTTYYYGWQGRSSLGYEFVSSNQFISYASAASCSNAISWLRTASVTVNENVTKEYFIGQTTGRDADDTLKGTHEVIGSMTYWLPDDMDATTLDIWTLKLPIDGLANNWAGVSFAVPSAAHGSNILHPFSLEIGHTLAGTSNPRYIQASGCTVSSFTLRARAGENIECSMDWQGKGVQWLSGAMTAPGRSTKEPLNFGHCTLKYGTSGSVTALQETTVFEFTIDQNLIPNYGLNAQGVRVITDMIAGKRDITGTMTIHMASGNVTNNLYADVLSGTTPSPHVANKSIDFIVAGSGASGSFATTFYGVVLGELTTDIDPTKVQELSVPFGAEEIVWKYYPAASTSIPTNWLQP